MTSNVLTFPSGGTSFDGRNCGSQSTPPTRHIVEVVRLDRAFGENEDPLLRHRIRVTKPSLVAPNSADGAVELFRQPLLRPTLLRAPIGQLNHETSRSLPKWLYRTLAMWQYANMAMAEIIYIRRVANDDEAPNRIQELIEAAGINQAELARRANVTVSALNKVIKGSRGLDQEWMRRLAPHLGVSPAELLPASDNPMTLSEAEKALIERFRRADRGTRSQFERVTEALLPSDASKVDAA
jgi:transcriptional regulator with XRE-family HTH domain